MTLVAVVVKRSRARNTFTYWGGILNPKAAYYVRRVTSKTNPRDPLTAIAKELSNA
jgi:hypothetical protein